MSHESRKGYYNRDWDRDRGRDRERERDRDRDRGDYRGRPPMRKRSRSPPRREDPKRSPRKNEKDILDENILSEISKLPEPSELWDNQFQEGFPVPPPPTFSQPPQEGINNSNYAGSYQPSYSGIYDDFPPVGSVPQAPHPPDIAAWNQMSLPPPPTQPPPAPPAPYVTNVEDQIKKDAAIESELRHQKAALSKQREEYIKKAGILKKELDTLKDQRNELRGDAKRSPSPDTKRFLKENTKLQLEIQNKLKTIYNVVDMLNGIIGEEAHEIHESDDSADRASKRKSRSPSNKKFNYVYYDPEMHWCRVCNEFPPTAKDYLNHLHSPAHHNLNKNYTSKLVRKDGISKMAAAHLEAPWHTVSGVNEGYPSYPSAPTKRTPIKGLQFFVPSTAWYCKLCDQFIGDLHCASAHLKSITHSKNYMNFVEQNPHWETDWMSDRQKAFEKSRGKMKSDGEKPQQYMSHTITFNKDGFHTKRKNTPPAGEDKKKKREKKKKNKRKRSSSSSSSSNSSSSDSEPVKKKSKVKKSKSRFEAPDDKTLTDWVSNIQMDRLNESDRKLLDTLKSRMKKDEQDKRRSPDRDRSTRDRERLSELQRKLRESERTERTERSEHSSRRSSSRRDERTERRSREATPPNTDNKPDIRKMPFIGKMPVFKNLSKNSKTEEQKKEEQKKKEEEEVTKKRREEMDAEIQKKVAEFKEKIARAQLEREQQQVQGCNPAANLAPNLAAMGPNPGQGLLPNPYLPAPHLATPTALGQAQPMPQPAQPPTPQPQPQLAQQPALPKDFQDALDIIFPTEVKNPELPQPDLFMPPGFMPGLAGVMPPFPPLPLMNPQMFGFDINTPIFQPRPQLYDTHVPLVPSPKPRHQPKRQQQKNDNKKKSEPPKGKETPKQAKEVKDNGEMARKKEEMDDLAMLGIDASDVGAGI